MANLAKIYSDIDLTFTRVPGTNDVALSYDEQAVIRSVRNILLTNRFERLFQPDIGSAVQLMLFENLSPSIANTLEEEIRITIQNEEPRVTSTTVRVTPDYDKNGYYVNLTFYIGNNTQPTVVGFLLERSR
jgi:phage baseplate assembly protein W